MKRKIKKFLPLALVFCMFAVLIPFSAIPVTASLTEPDQLTLSSPNGTIYPDIEAFRNERLNLAFFHDTEQYLLDASVTVPDSFDTPMTADQIQQVQQAMGQPLLDFEGQATPAAVLSVANNLQVGDTWLDALFNLEKAFGSNSSSWSFEVDSVYPNYTTWDDYFKDYFLKTAFGYNYGIDSNATFSASDSYDDIGKAIMSESTYQDGIWATFSDYKLDVDALDENNITIVGNIENSWITDSTALGTIDAYDLSGNKITPASITDVSYTGHDYNAAGVAIDDYPVVASQYTFNIPVAVGASKATFVDPNGIVMYNGNPGYSLTINVGQINGDATPPTTTTAAPEATTTPAQYNPPYIAPSTTQPTTPSTTQPATEATTIASTEAEAAPLAPVATATPTLSTITVNGKPVDFDVYNINGNTYFKLRDLAYILSGTDKQFEVTWDGTTNSIYLTSGEPYTAVGGEMVSKGTDDQTATLTASTIYLDGVPVALTAYNIGGNNYFKLRDIGQALDFGVTWDGESNTIIIDTSTSYTPA